MFGMTSTNSFPHCAVVGGLNSMPLGQQKLPWFIPGKKVLVSYLLPSPLNPFTPLPVLEIHRESDEIDLIKLVGIRALWD